MNLENQKSDSSQNPNTGIIRQAQKCLSKGDLETAKKLLDSVLETVDRQSDENLILRVDACNGLIVRAALKKKRDSILHAFQKLSTELDVQQDLSQPVRETIAAKINAITETLGSMRSWVAVKKLSRLIFKIVNDDTPDSLSHRIRALNNLGSALIAEKRFDDAAHIWHCAIKDHGEKGKQNCPAPLATIHNNLAELLRLEGQFPLSQFHHEQALELRLGCFEETHVLVRQSRFNLAQIQTESYDFVQADEQIQALLQSYPEDGHQKKTEYLRAQTLKSRLLMELGKYLSAEKLVNQLARLLPDAGYATSKLKADVHLTRLELAIRLKKTNIIQSESARLPDVLEQSNLLKTVYEGRFNLLSGIALRECEQANDNSQAESYFQKAAKIFHSRLPRNHPLLAYTVFQLAESFSDSARLKRGSQTANSALSILEKTFGKQSIPLFAGLLGMTKIVLMQQQYNVAMQLLKLAAGTVPKDQAVSATLTLKHQSLLIQTYSYLKKPKEAAYYARQAFHTISELMESPASQKIELVEQAYQLSSDAGHVDDALTLLKRKIELLSEEYHSAHPTVSEATEQLGRLYAKQGDSEKAAEHLSSVLTVRCGELGEESALAMELMELTANMHRQAGQDDKADQIDQQAQQINDKSSHVLSDLF